MLTYSTLFRSDLKSKTQIPGAAILVCGAQYKIRVLQCSFFSFLSMLNTMASEQGQLYLTKNLERGVVNEKILDFFSLAKVTKQKIRSIFTVAIG